MRSSVPTTAPTRRLLLRGAGVALTLPFLPSALPRAAWGSAPPAPPIRLVVCVMPNGIYTPSCQPVRTGARYDLPEIAAPMAALQSRFTIVSGLENLANAATGGSHNQAMGSLLTDSLIPAFDAAVTKGISFDQVAAEHIRGETPFPSLQVGVENLLGPQTTYSQAVSWGAFDNAYMPILDPRTLFTRLFGDDTLPAEDIEARKVVRSSILDRVLDRTLALRTTLAPADRTKLDQYEDGIRELELQIDRLEDIACEAPDIPRTNLPFDLATDVQYALVRAALECDLTRVITFMQGPSASYETYTHLGIETDDHTLSHEAWTSDESLTDRIAMEVWRSERYATFVQSMADTVESDGSDLLSNTVCVVTSEFGEANLHTSYGTYGLPVGIAGGERAGIVQGTHRAVGSQSHANLWVGLLNHLGVDQATFGTFGTTPLNSVPSRARNATWPTMGGSRGALAQDDASRHNACMHHVVGRDDELERLDELLAAGGGLGVLYGRRRVGKTRLLVEWAGRRGGLYTVADQSSPDVQRRYCAEALQNRFPGFGEVTYPDWGTLLARLAREASAAAWSGPVVFDELPYLVQTSPELPSVLQRWVDHDASELVVVVAGSSQRMMQGLVLSAGAPLYGRARQIVEVQPLGPRWLSAAFHTESGTRMVELWSAWGGIPRYWELAVAERGGVAATVDRLVLDPLGPLHREPDRLIAEELPPATEVRALLDAIGGGAHRASEIAGRIGRPSTSLARPLQRLQEMGLVRREVPFGEPARSTKRSLYRIADPFTRLWFRVVAPNRAQLATSSAAVRRAILARHWPHLVAEAWEELCRSLLPFLDPRSRLGALGPWEPGARWWRGSEPEWDVVARSVDGRRVLLGEVKTRVSSWAAAQSAVSERPPPTLPGLLDAEVVRVSFVATPPPGQAPRGPVRFVTATDLLG